MIDSEKAWTVSTLLSKTFCDEEIMIHNANTSFRLCFFSKTWLLLLLRLGRTRQDLHIAVIIREILFNQPL